MADIYLARATSVAGVERYVVLKRVIAERSKDPQLARMFLDEARLVAQLQHPNIAQVHDIGEIAGAYFFTMEFVHGEDVRHVMQRLAVLGRSLPIQHALHIAAGALAGLHHAHERITPTGKHLAVVHRDVSPSNVMIAFEGVIKLLDFGVAKATERLSEESKSGTIKGKIAYLSPEQCHGNPVDRRSDIFSLGIVLHELLTGLRLFRRDTDLATMLAITQQPIPPPSAERKELSAALDGIVMKALARDPNARFQTAAEMLEAIEEVATSERHVMSATAMSRFMRDVFGDRTEPWVKLGAPDEGTRPITITSESFSVTGEPLVPVPKSSTTSGTVPRNVAVPHDLAAQLEAAQPLSWPHDPSPAVPLEPMQQFVSGAIRVPTPPPTRAPTPPPIPRAATAPPRISTVQPAVELRGEGTAATTPNSMPLPTPPHGVPSGGFPEVGDLLQRETASIGIVGPAIARRDPTGAARRDPTASATALTASADPVASRRRLWVVIGGAAAVLGGVIAAAALPRSSEPAATPEPSERTVMSEQPAVAADAAVDDEAVAEVDVAAPAAAVDAAVATNTGDAAVAAPATTAPPPTIASAATAKDWTAASRLCARSTTLTAADRVSCALAACNTKQRAPARAFYLKVTDRTQRATIERACRSNAINLTGGGRPTGGSPKDPCATNPMKCRK